MTSPRTWLNNEPTSLRHHPAQRHAQKVRDLLDQYEVDADADAVVANLPNDLKKMVQIVKAVSLDPRILLLDEPTSSLTDSEVQVVLRLIRKLADDGVGVVLISHYLNEIFDICDDLTVMRDGEVVADGRVAETSLAHVVTLMIGRHLESSSPRKATTAVAQTGEPLLRVEDLAVAGRLRKVNFVLGRGEVLGITGLAGSVLENSPRQYSEPRAEAARPAASW